MAGSAHNSMTIQTIHIPLDVARGAKLNVKSVTGIGIYRCGPQTQASSCAKHCDSCGAVSSRGSCRNGQERQLQGIISCTLELSAATCSQEDEKWLPPDMEVTTPMPLRHPIPTRPT